ncbi:MAG: ABC transporter ATP-binding protein [Clostridia bacterium]|nr:ABC transporter ATP-binding protein [Clostridia bacterium]
MEMLMPNYMSDIVNIGIQQGGFEDGVPPDMTEEGMQLVSMFMTPEEQQLLRDSYTGNGGQYRLGDVSEQQRTKLDQAFGLSEWTMLMALRQMPGADDMMSQMTGSGSLADTDVSNLDLSAFDQIMPQLEALPREAVDSARASAERVDSSMREQTAAAFARLLAEQAGVDDAVVQSNYLTQTGVQMVIVALLCAAASISAGFLAARIGASVARKLRADLFARVESFSNKEISQFSTASLITRSTNDITQIQQFTIMAVRMLIFSLLMGIGGVIMALLKSTSMAWVIGVAVLVMLGIVALVFSLAMPKFKILQKLVDRINLVARENLTGMLVVRAFRTQEFEEQRFDDANSNLGSTTLFANRVMALVQPAMMLVMNGLSLAIVWIGAEQVQHSAMQVGDIMAYIQYAMIIIMSFMFIAAMFGMLPRASVSLDRVFEVLDTQPEIVEPEHPKPFVADELGVVKFDHVYFEYEGAEEPVLKDISFTARPGEVTGIIGPTGSGKSTLINLIPRFYDATRGSVDVSGVNVKDANLYELREEIGFVPQKGALFSGTIASNLRYGARDASDKDIETAAEIAQAMEFIEQKSEGLNAPVAEGGSNVSGGQRQRLAIGRALAKKAPIYIFDDSFSALDAKTDAKLRSELGPYTENSTVLVVAQKISSILNADQILVLEDGRLVGKGTHAELMKTCPEYIEIAKSQLGEDVA